MGNGRPRETRSTHCRSLSFFEGCCRTLWDTRVIRAYWRNSGWHLHESPRIREVSHAQESRVSTFCQYSCQTHLDEVARRKMRNDFPKVYSMHFFASLQPHSILSSETKSVYSVKLGLKIAGSSNCLFENTFNAAINQIRQTQKMPHHPHAWLHWDRRVFIY